MATPSTLPTEVNTVIVGAGQAGLAVARQLQRCRVDALVLDAHARVGDNWRQRYDSLVLFTSNKVNHLPGLPFPGPGNRFAAKDEMADYLAGYARHFRLPVELGVRVLEVSQLASRFQVRTERGTITARNVVLATGPYGQLPSLPEAAAGFDDSILQLHSTQYRRPDQLRPGPVLVVGASHSGCDIALELAATHQTILAGRDTGQVPFDWSRPYIHRIIPLVMFSHKHLHTRATAAGRADRERKLAHGIPRLRVKMRDLERAGVRHHAARVSGSKDGQPQLADGTVIPARNVIWATGCHHDYYWLRVPVLDEHGWPVEYRGVAKDVPGIYFCGLAYQYALASLNPYGVGRDARYVARHIARRTAVPLAEPARQLR